MEDCVICPICGKKFEPKRASQRFCSRICQRKAYRMQKERKPLDSCGLVLRRFTCVRCGTVVNVTDSADRRTKFCSSRCERLYWKHGKKAGAGDYPRTFQCRQCGKLVTVASGTDHRTAFCSNECRLAWRCGGKKQQYLEELKQQEAKENRNENNE